jgi:hypothetical protein
MAMLMLYPKMPTVPIVGMFEIQSARQGMEKFPAQSRREFAWPAAEYVPAGFVRMTRDGLEINIMP